MIVALLPDTGERYLSTILYAFEEYLCKKEKRERIVLWLPGKNVYLPGNSFLIVC